MNHPKTKARKNPKPAQHLVGVGLGGIQPVNLSYRQPKSDPDLEVGSHPTTKPLNQGVGREGTEMSTVVFFGIPAHGHFNPTLGVVRELVNRGYRVVYYCTEEFSTKLVDAGAEFRSYRKDFSADIQRQGMNPLELAYTLLNTALFILENLLGEVRAEQPDCILHDSHALWGLLIARILGVPAVCSISTFAFNRELYRVALKDSVGQLLPALSFKSFKYLSLISKAKKDLEVRYNYHFRGFNDLSENYEALNLVYTSTYFQPAVPSFDNSFAFIGPSIVERCDESDLPWDHFATQRLIYISLGTIFGQTSETYRMFFETFRNRDFHVILSAGKGAELISPDDIPANFTVRKHVPQLEVLKRASVFITHGGMNSASEGLYFGVPLIVIPQGLDQPLVARQVERLGAGIYLRKNRLSPKTLTTAINLVTQDTGFRDNARLIADSFRSAGGFVKAVDEITRLLAEDTSRSSR